MSFANKGRDSKDVEKLRGAYESLARQTREAKDPQSQAALREKKNEAFEKVKTQVTAERRDNLSGLHKVLIQQGKLKTPEQMHQAKADAEAAAKARSNK